MFRRVHIAAKGIPPREQQGCSVLYRTVCMPRCVCVRMFVCMYVCMYVGHIHVRYAGRFEKYIPLCLEIKNSLLICRIIVVVFGSLETAYN